MHSLIAQRQSEIAAICRHFGVRRLEVVGSAARGTDFDSADSDADFLVAFGPAGPEISPLKQYFGFAEALERLLGRHVDLIEAGALRNPFVLASINQAREMVYAS